MDDLDGVEVIEAAQQLLQDDLDDTLIEFVPGLDEVNEGPPVAELHDHLVSVVPLEHLVQFDDVGMIHLLEQFQFCEDLISLSPFQNFLLDDLDGPEFI